MRRTAFVVCKTGSTPIYGNVHLGLRGPGLRVAFGAWKACPTNIIRSYSGEGRVNTMPLTNWWCVYVPAGGI